ncbi:MAG: SDR family NAD(P)-dependent oxidoreductase [Polyangiaceae bacterium]|nr:SDR family NAD(P)-dependent oxidoreductase [Polyangiaceae bacterium]
MKAIFLGATKGMGRALARSMARRGDELFLLGRDLEDLDKSTADLAVDGKKPAGVATCDLAEPASFGRVLDDAIVTLGGHVDAVIVTAGLFATQDKLESDLDLCRRVLDVDFTGTVLFCEEAKKRLLAQGGGVLCVFSSVAGERGRKPVVLYGAAKAGLTRYLEGLDHKHRAEGLAVVTVKPGFVKTGLTAGLKPPPFAGEPEDVAERVLSAIDKKRPVVYAPAAWGPIMAVIRSLPRFVMRRVGF